MVTHRSLLGVLIIDLGVRLRAPGPGRTLRLTGAEFVILMFRDTLSSGRLGYVKAASTAGA